MVVAVKGEVFKDAPVSWLELQVHERHGLALLTGAASNGGGHKALKEKSTAWVDKAALWPHGAKSCSGNINFGVLSLVLCWSFHLSV